MDKTEGAAIPKAVMLRLPRYLSYLKSLSGNQYENISAPAIAAAMHLGGVQVRKDLAYVTDSGKPKIGYRTETLISDLEHFLGYNKLEEVLLVGAGKLGRALLGYNGFRQYGLNVCAAFDVVTACGITPNGKYVYPISEFPFICKSTKARLGIICVPKERAQEICNMMVSSGIKAIMNFAPVHLAVPDGILVQNANIAASLALLSIQLNAED